MDWLWNTLGLEAFASNFSLGIWLSALGGSSVFASGTVLVSLRKARRRIVRTLRYATVACVVELMGLTAMVLIDNPGKWELGPWLLSLFPFLLAMTGVLVTFSRGGELPPPTEGPPRPVHTAELRPAGPPPARSGPAVANRSPAAVAPKSTVHAGLEPNRQRADLHRREIADCREDRAGARS